MVRFTLTRTQIIITFVIIALGLLLFINRCTQNKPSLADVDKAKAKVTTIDSTIVTVQEQAQAKSTEHVTKAIKTNQNTRNEKYIPIVDTSFVNACRYVAEYTPR